MELLILFYISMFLYCLAWFHVSAAKTRKARTKYYGKDKYSAPFAFFMALVWPVVAYQLIRTVLEEGHEYLNF